MTDQLSTEELREIRRTLESLRTAVSGMLRAPTDWVAIAYATSTLESSIEATRIVEKHLPG